MMRRALLAVGILAMVGCGISAVATRDGADGTDPPDAKVDPNIPDTTPAPGSDGGGPDAEIDSTAEGGVAFAPSHLKKGDYALDAADVSLTEDTVIDTTDLTVDDVPVPTTFRASKDGKVAVWSVGKFTTSAHITIKGSRGLAIVASGDVDLTGLMSAGASLTTAGPGGLAAALGDSKGTNGGKVTIVGVGNYTGGGGAGSFTKGGAGGKVGMMLAGPAGGTAMTPLDLVGGSGGGNGGNHGGGSAACGHGGPGGGAVQISSAGTIRFNASAVIDVAGGGGSGGCEDTDLSAGGGGGAGGLIFLEAIAGIALPAGATLIASGGGGGEGGDVNSPGGDGHPGGIGTSDLPLGAGGGNGTTFGGKGGNGGVGPTATPVGPVDGQTGGLACGGGGGAMGRVYFRSRGNNVVINGAVYAASVQDPSF